MLDYAKYINKSRAELADLRAYKLNRSKIFKRAHYLTRTEDVNMSEALKQCYSEFRNYVLKVADKIKEITLNLADRYSVKPQAKDWNESFNFNIKLNNNFSPNTIF